MPTFMRGAKPSPRHKLLAAVPYRVTAIPAPQFAVVPPKLDMWDNDRDGVCVSSEEAFAKAWWSVYCGLPETFATSAEVRAFAAKYGWLDGATLTEVMDVMVSTGMPIGGTLYKDGGYLGVDYSNELILQSAIDPTDGTGGPVKIAIDANALPPGAGNQQGWYATKGGNYPNTDHCVSLGGYGRADFLFDQLKVPLPPGLSPSTPAYHLYTWKTIGVVTHDWLMGTCVEAWVRQPTTAGQTPTPTPPVPPVPPSPPSPPVPPNPQPVQVVNIPAQTVHTPFFGGNVTIPGQTVQVTTRPGFVEYGGGDWWSGAQGIQSAPAVGSPNWLNVFLDGLQLIADVRARNVQAILTDVEKLAADLGIPIPATPTP